MEGGYRVDRGQFSMTVLHYSWFLTGDSSIMSFREKKVPFSMAIGNGEFMQECFPKHSRMGTAIMK